MVKFERFLLNIYGNRALSIGLKKDESLLVFNSQFQGFSIFNSKGLDSATNNQQPATSLWPVNL